MPIWHGVGGFMFNSSSSSARIAPSQVRIATIRHGLNVFVLIFPCFGHFGWPFPRWGAPLKNYHLESGSNQRDRATGGFGRSQTHRKPGKFSTGGAFAFPRQKKTTGSGVENVVESESDIGGFEMPICVGEAPVRQAPQTRHPNGETKAENPLRCVCGAASALWTTQTPTPAMGFSALSLIPKLPHPPT